MNNVEIEGGLANAPDFGFTKSGRAWARFTLAVSEVRWNARTSSEEISTTWVSCQAWGSQAEELMKDDPVRGEKLYVKGRLDQSEFQDSDGKTQRKTRVEIVVYQFTSRKARRAEPVPA